MAITRVLLRTAAGPAFRRALPVYLGIAIIAGVIFGKNGMQPADVAAAAAHSRGFRLVLWALWLFATAPAAHALFHTRELEYLRWLPARPWHIHAVLAAGLAGLHAPWALLWALGQGITGMLAALALGVAVHALASLRARNRLELAAVLALLAAAAAALALPAPPGVLLAGSATVALLAVPAAWTRAPEKRSGRGMRRLSSHPLLALAQTHATGLVRTRPAVLARGVIIIFLGAGLTLLIARANNLAMDELAVYSSFIAVIALALATAGLAAPLAETEHALDWLLHSTGASRDLRTGARVLAAGLAGALLGVMHGAVVVWGAGAFELRVELLGAARIVGEAAAVGAALALIAQRSARWIEPSPGTAPSTAPGVDSSAGGGVDGSRVVALVTLATIAALIAIAVLGDLAVLALLGFGVAVSMSGRPV